MRNWVRLLQLLRLDGEIEAFESIHSTIEKDIIFKGTNLWILVFAIIIASVGLNINSTAVVIGAMLISPLMGPINGIGYSIATFNRPLFSKAVKNYSFAVGASLVASTTYFALSPVSTAHSEILARTSPSIYDVLIAMFGGFAGMVAISSRQKGNVIPGVAIATALMPPLCTAGYGLATAQFNFFFGALYLFTINTVFIALASVFVSKLLKFPIAKIVESGDKKRINQLLSAVIFITLIPSIYFGYILVQNEKFNENVARFTNNISVYEGSYLLRHETEPGKRKILLTYGGNVLAPVHKARLREKARDFMLEDADIEIRQGFSINEAAVTETEKLKFEIGKLRNAMAFNKQQRDSIVRLFNQGEALLRELNAVYPSIKGASYAETKMFSMTGDPQKVVQVTFKIDSKNFPDADKVKIEAWLKERLKIKVVKVHYEEDGVGSQ